MFPMPLEIDLSHDFAEIGQFGSVFVSLIRIMSFSDIPAKSQCKSYSNWSGPGIIEMFGYFGSKTFSFFSQKVRQKKISTKKNRNFLGPKKVMTDFDKKRGTPS